MGYEDDWEDTLDAQRQVVVTADVDHAAAVVQSDLDHIENATMGRENVLLQGNLALLTSRLVVASRTEPPKDDRPGFRQLFVDSFDVDAALGTLRAVNGNLRPYRDGTSGRYWPSKTLSIHDSCLDIWLHRDDELGKEVSAAVGFGVLGQSYPMTYGRFTIRHRTVGGAGWGAVVMLWPYNDVHAEGELDYPEGPLAGRFAINHHQMIGDPRRLYYQTRDLGAWADWHVSTIDWTPTEIRYYLDDLLVGRVTDKAQIPLSPHKWVLQAGFDAAPPATTEGHILVDWVAAYALSVT